jgi:4'-phosphopantetheinyl transferase
MNINIEPVILFHKIDFALPERISLSMMNRIREEKRLRIQRFKFRDDLLRGLFGELLLKYALSKYFDIEYEKETIREDEFGKPHLINKQISFNISHSGNWVGVICYKNKCGIDIERIENPPYEIMPKTFTSQEIEQIVNSDPIIQAQQFYNMWTLKESYIKMIGRGLSIPLDSFSIDSRNRNSIIVKDYNRQTTDINFRLFNPDPEHILALCLPNYKKDVSTCTLSQPYPPNILTVL